MLVVVVVVVRVEARGRMVLGRVVSVVRGEVVVVVEGGVGC